MTLPVDPTRITALLEQLISQWRTKAVQHDKHGDCYRVGMGWGLNECADELEAVLASLVTPSEPLWTPKNPERTAEQQARDLLERLGWDEAQSLTAGDVCELANLIAECSRLRTQSVSPQPPETEGKEAK